LKKLIVFDLDGTLAESKASLDMEMTNLLNVLLEMVKVKDPHETKRVIEAIVACLEES